MKVVSVPLGSRGADMAQALTSAAAQALRGAGLDYVCRYLGGLDPHELDEILAADLGLQLVTYSRAPGWAPSRAIGQSDGATDLAHLQALSVPAGALVWIDLEGVSGTAADTAAWIDARSAVLVGAGYVAGAYVGDSPILNGAELYALVHVSRYWRGFNQGIPEPKCGWCQLQTFPPNQMLAGIEIDRDFAQSDYAGRVPLMLVA